MFSRKIGNEIFSRPLAAEPTSEKKKKKKKRKSEAADGETTLDGSTIEAAGECTVSVLSEIIVSLDSTPFTLGVRKV